MSCFAPIHRPAGTAGAPLSAAARSNAAPRPSAAKTAATISAEAMSTAVATARIAAAKRSESEQGDRPERRTFRRRCPGARPLATPPSPVDLLRASVDVVREAPDEPEIDASSNPLSAVARSWCLAPPSLRLSRRRQAPTGSPALTDDSHPLLPASSPRPLLARHRVPFRHAARGDAKALHASAYRATNAQPVARPGLGQPPDFWSRTTAL